MYQDFEIPRVKAAFAAFEKAFEDGYVEGLKLLAEGLGDRPNPANDDRLKTGQRG